MRNDIPTNRNFNRIPIAACAAILTLGIFLFIFIPSSQAAESSSDIAGRVERQQEQLNQLRAQLQELDALLARRDETLDKNRQDLADANARLSSAEDRYVESLEAYEGRITALYKQGEDQFIKVILSSEDFTGAITRVTYLSKISENDMKLLERVKAEAEEVRIIREEVDELKQMTAGDVGSLMERKSELVGQIDEAQSSLDRDMVKLVTARQVEQEAAARRLSEEAASLEFMDPLSTPVVASSEPPAGMQPTGTVLRGVASWYGPGFHGNRTANGEIYDMYGFTAAHKTLPFNTWLKVTYNGRSVFVRINDRGPYIGGRFLDLSKGAAQALGFSGVGYVTAEIYR